MSEFDVSRVEEVGGWFNVSIYPVSDILSSPGYLTNQNATNVVFAATNDLIDFLPIGENISISEPVSVNAEGSSYNIAISFELFLQNELIDEYLNSYLNKEVVAVAENHSGKKKLYGCKKFPLNFGYTPINGQRAEDGNRYNVIVRGNIPQKPVYILD